MKRSLGPGQGDTAKTTRGSQTVTQLCSFGMFPEIKRSCYKVNSSAVKMFLFDSGDSDLWLPQDTINVAIKNVKVVELEINSLTHNKS